VVDIGLRGNSTIVTEAISSPGSGSNEDRTGASGQLSWVIDGATPLEGTHRARVQTMRLVDRIDEGLQEAGTSNGAALDDALGLLRRIASDTSTTRRRGAILPTAAVGIVEVHDDRLDYFLLGDVTVAVDTGGSVFAASDHRVGRFDAVSIAAIASAQARGMTLEEARASALPVLRSNRLRGNSAGAYWIVAPGSPEAVDHGIRASVPLSRAFTLLVASDGFARLVDLFRSPTDWSELLHSARERSLEELVAELRQLERMDSECLQFPRLSVSDDASAVLVQRT